mmetsp:Transcript_10935/g.32775  ORF Transcript_10935/g.32775 Transcript_10935/m.32775 type:complete len:210 (+) Transcript_10935:795-1424(+)
MTGRHEAERKQRLIRTMQLPFAVGHCHLLAAGYGAKGHKLKGRVCFGHHALLRIVVGTDPIQKPWIRAVDHVEHRQQLRPSGRTLGSACVESESAGVHAAQEVFKGGQGHAHAPAALLHTTAAAFAAIKPEVPPNRLCRVNSLLHHPRQVFALRGVHEVGCPHFGGQEAWRRQRIEVRRPGRIVRGIRGHLHSPSSHAGEVVRHIRSIR